MNNQELVEQFSNKYLEEYDFKYATANLPIDPVFLSQVQTYIEIAIGATSAGFFGKMGSDLYDKIKSSLFKEIKEKYKKSDDRVLIIEGAGYDKTILNFGQTRPIFRIGKGNKLILKNLTITYQGDPIHLIEEELAPSFFPINVKFKQIP